MFRKLHKRIRIWRHWNDRVIWQARESGVVPGSDCPWEAGDKFELYSPNGKICGSGKIDEQFANDINIALRWNKDFKSSE